MNFIAILHALSIVMIGVSLCTIVPLITAINLNESPQIFAFSFTLIFGVLLGLGGWLLTSLGNIRHQNGPSEVLAFALFFWFSAPVLCSLPFVLGVANPSVYLAIQEATSCLTTTGYTVVDIGREGWPISLIVWRGILHLVGAFASIVTLVGVLSQINKGGRTHFKTPYSSESGRDVFENLTYVALRLGRLYVGFSVLVFLALLAVGVDLLGAFLDMASVVSTGNANPLSQDYSDHGLRVMIVCCGLLVSTAGFWALYFIGRWDVRPSARYINYGAFAVVVVALGILAYLSGLGIGSSVLWAISAISTSDIYHMSGTISVEVLPLSLIILPALLGGAALSTTGGTKLTRILFIFYQVRHEVRQSLTRSGVSPDTVQRNGQNFQHLANAWVYLVCFAVAIGLMQFILCLAGVGWTDAIRLSIGALCNAGGLIDQAQETTRLTGVAGGSVLIAMLLGRIEILPIIVVFTKNFWTR